jgi:hypothetical protein
MHSLRLVGRKLDALPNIPEVQLPEAPLRAFCSESDRSDKISSNLVGQGEAALLTAPMEASDYNLYDYFTKIIVKYEKYH